MNLAIKEIMNLFILNKMKNLEQKAKKLRKDVIEMGMQTGEAHLGGSLSEIELLISLYDVIMKKEDKFILSKAHASHPMYLLLQEKGYDPKISTHPDLDEKNGIYCTTGSLGHGLPIGVGMAFARKHKKKGGNIYVLMGDGECQEGTTWESMLLASHYKLDNLTTIIDYNKLQGLNKINDILSLKNLRKNFEAFGGYTQEINGHNFKEIISALKKKKLNQPKIIIAHTIKGKGISYMENEQKWHVRLPNEEELKQAYEELK